MGNNKKKAGWFIRALSSGDVTLDAETARQMALQLNMAPNEKYYCVAAKYQSEELLRTDADAVEKLAYACGYAGKHFDEYIYCYIGNQLYTVMIFAEHQEKESVVINLKQEIERKCGYSIKLGVGKSYKRIEKLNDSRVEAYEALLTLGEHSDISYIEDLYSSQSMTSQKLAQEKQHIITLFKRGDLDNLEKNVALLTERVRMESPIREDVPYPTSIRRTIVELLVAIMYICSDAGIDVDKELNYQDPYRRVFELKTTPDILQWFSDTVRHLHTKVQERTITTENNMLSLAQKCIAENIKNPELSLSLVSDALNITPTYFSSFFIREMGVGFNEYITNIRIDQAKKLLKTTNQKVGIIAEECGFRSSSYFIVVFRKWTGMSPGEYRNIKI